MAIDFEKFNKQYDVEGLKKELKETQENGPTYKEVPLGTYEVQVVSLELSESKSGKPMVKGSFKVLEGEFKGNRIWMNQLVDERFKIQIILDFLKSLQVFDDEDIYFDGYPELNDLLLDITQEIENQKLEYLLEYSQNNKGYNQYKIKDVYTAK